MLRDVLNITTAQVARESVSGDGYGGTSAVTTLTTLSCAAIWSPSGRETYLSGRITRISSHVLACETSEYTWNQNDRYVLYDGSTYKVVGRPDDVMNLGELTVVPLELQT